MEPTIKPIEDGKFADDSSVAAVPWLMYLLIGLAGLTISSIVVYGFRMGERMTTVDAQLVNGAARIKLEATIAGLMFEEIYNSGIVGDFELNWEYLDRAVSQVQTALTEGQTKWESFLLFRCCTGQEEIRLVADQLSSLKSLARARLLNHERSLIPTDIDQQYHQGFETFLNQILQLEERLEHGMAVNLNRFRYTQMFLIAACFLLSLTICIAFLRFERHRTKMLQSLFETQEKMKQEMLKKTRAEQALFERSQALEKSNQNLERFAYVASHDLQEPLRMVTSYVQLLSMRYKGKLDKDADDFIGFARDGAERMQEMIRALLVFSRVGTDAKDYKTVDTGSILDDVKDNLKIAIQSCGAVITHGTLPAVWGEAMQLNQLLQNLISNAIKFRGEAPPKIRVSAILKDDHWEFAVSDNGIGIDSQFSDKIFTIFKRLHSIADYPGTGIGLAICRKIVEAHGGQIRMESGPGDGTTFYFTIPTEERP